MMARKGGRAIPRFYAWLSIKKNLHNGIQTYIIYQHFKPFNGALSRSDLDVQITHRALLSYGGIDGTSLGLKVGKANGVVYRAASTYY